MEVSRLTFTKETREKMEKGLNKREKGELRFKRLKELEESGELSKATSRTDIAKMMGFMDTKAYGGTGYNWVSNLIRRRHLTETLISTNSLGKMEFEYHIANSPNFKVGVKADTKPEIKTSNEFNDKKFTKVTIYYGELSIEIERVDYSFLSQLVSSIVNRRGHSEN